MTLKLSKTVIGTLHEYHTPIYAQFLNIYRGRKSFVVPFKSKAKIFLICTGWIPADSVLFCGTCLRCYTYLLALAFVTKFINVFFRVADNCRFQSTWGLLSKYPVLLYYNTSNRPTHLTYTHLAYHISSISCSRSNFLVWLAAMSLSFCGCQRFARGFHFNLY